jgi:NAD(P) transhydrogenase subunit beta
VTDQWLVQILYLASAVLFILGLKGLTRVRTARRGNALSTLAMGVAVVATLMELGLGIDYRWILAGLVVGSAIGAFAAIRVQMTSMPEMVALFNGSGGVASALVALSIIWQYAIQPGTSRALVNIPEVGAVSGLTTVLSILIGGITFTGSIVAFLKLSQERKFGSPVLVPGRHAINLLLLLGSLAVGGWFVFEAADPGMIALVAVGIFVAALALGVMLVIPIGGADMPVVVSLLNSYSGLAAAATGFVLKSNVLIISGALVGASGLILTQIMCVAMNRTLANVLFGGFGQEAQSGGTGGSADEYENVRSYGAEDVALVLETADTVIVAPGYGLAVAQAQHAVKELASVLEARGTKVAYAIHPVAGRMPGHMNVLLAEADVPYEQLQEMERINSDFKNTDVVLVLGANDVVNPAAETTPGSPIYGMPVLQVWDAQTVVVVKRSLSPGFAKIKNELFERPNTMMLFADAKQALQDLVSELKRAAAA